MKNNLVLQVRTLNYFLYKLLIAFENSRDSLVFTDDRIYQSAASSSDNDLATRLHA